MNAKVTLGALVLALSMFACSKQEAAPEATPAPVVEPAPVPAPEATAPVTPAPEATPPAGEAPKQ